MNLVNFKHVQYTGISETAAGISKLLGKLLFKCSTTSLLFCPNVIDKAVFYPEFKSTCKYCKRSLFDRSCFLSAIVKYQTYKKVFYMSRRLLLIT